MNLISQGDWEEIWSWGTHHPDRGSVTIIREYAETNHPDNSFGTELFAAAVMVDNNGYWSLEAQNDYTGWGCLGDRVDWFGPFDTEEIAVSNLSQESRVFLGYEEGRYGEYGIFR